MAELHRAVIDALKVTFSEATFEEYLRDQAADTEQIAARRAERENLLQQIPKLAAAEAKLAKVIAVTDDVDALVAELKATQQERRQAEARVADLEGYERDLRDQQEQVERGTSRSRWSACGGSGAAGRPPWTRTCRPPGRSSRRSWWAGSMSGRSAPAPGASPVSAGTMAP
jgi:septal ring factor EnvC (AmiA/AmiB activator)